MDKVMDYLQANSDDYGIDFFYVTLGEYFDAVYAANRTWQPYSGDFFTYDDGPKSYWSGYYSSRSALKSWVRTREAVQRTAETLVALFSAASPSPVGPVSCGSGTNVSVAIEAIREATAELTHHDAVAGTSLLPVVQYYAQHLADASATVSPVITALVSSVNLSAGLHYTMDQGVLQNLTIDDGVILTAYNSLAWATRQWLRVGVYQQNINVTDSAGDPVPSQVNPRKPSSPMPCETGYGCGFDTAAPYDLFLLASLPPLGFASFRVSLTNGPPPTVSRVSTRSVSGAASSGATFQISNTFLSLTFSNTTGLLLSISSRVNTSMSANLSSGYYSYTPASLDGFNVTENPYVFHPAGPATPVALVPLSFSLVLGPYVSEVRQFFTLPCGTNTSSPVPCGVTQTYRLYSSPGGSHLDNAVEIISDLGPLAVHTDVSVRFSSSLQNQGVFYTDDNCWENHMRVFNQSLSDPISGNFYPVPCWLYLQDAAANAQLTLLADRTHAGSSLSAGQLEMILHRRLNTTDFRGLTLNDIDRLENIGTLLLFDSINNSVSARHRLTYLRQFPPTLFFSPSSQRQSPPPSYSAVGSPFPPNVHLLTLAAYNCTTTLLRLAHVFEPGEATNLSAPVTLDLSSFFQFTSVEERSLSTVWGVDEVVRRRWNVSRADPRPPAGRAGSDDPGSVTLVAGQIRTFFVTALVANPE